MAQITAATNEKVFQIQRWLGLNENPDGDTKLKMGEAAEMRNFRVTRDGNLQKRPGTRDVLTIPGNAEIEAVWTGWVGVSESAEEYVLAIAGGKLWSCLDANGDWAEVPEEIGSVGQTDHPHMFGFSNRVYVLTGSEYMAFDGSSLYTVEGYMPLVAVSIPPMIGSNPSGGELLEQVNKLTGKRRAWLSPDGTNRTFQLPETGLLRVIGVYKTTDDTAVSGWTADTAAGTVTFTTAPAKSVNSLEVRWEMDEDFRNEITGMRFSETYNGTQDTRVFLYGDGSNEALYSEVDYWGQASAEYFPDQNEVRVGVSNTPITAMIRHYGNLVAFKTDGTYLINYGVVTLADTSIAAAFYVTPVNRAIGNIAPGQAQLVLNTPVVLFGSDVYEWRNNASYASNLSVDERQARRISDRIHATLSRADLSQCVCYDDNYHQEYYISDRQGKTLVWNYAADVWYLYTGFPMVNPFSYRNELYYTIGPAIIHVSTAYAYDCHENGGELAVIPCYWESGAMSFGADYQRKYSAMLWLGIKPEASASIDVSVMTDRTTSRTTKTVDYALFDFEHVDFSKFTFETNDKAQMRRLKLKAKKFVYYKLLLKSENNDYAATVTAADIRVRFTGYAK